MTTTANYGPYTVCRPMLATTPDPGFGWELVACPYCGQFCWKKGLEPDPLPRGVTAACTACALRRAVDREAMDAARAAREVLRN